MLSNMIPNYNQEIERLREVAPAGFTLAFNLTFRGPEHLHTEFPKEWQEIYQSKNYFFLDPILLWTFTNTGERRWSEVTMPDVRGVLAAARPFGLVYGAIFARRRGDRRSLLSIARPDREFTDTEISIVGARFDSWVDMVIGTVALTPGELEVLRALKDGLGQQEIALKLGVSESAVKQRCLKACAKLNARTRTQAVAIAVARNYFES